MPPIGVAPVSVKTYLPGPILGRLASAPTAAPDSGTTCSRFVLYLRPGMIQRSPSTSGHVIAAASILRQAVNSVNRTYAPNGSWRPLAAQMRRNSSSDRILSLDPSLSVLGPIPRTTGEVKSSDLAACQFSTLLTTANTSLAVASPLVSAMLSSRAVIVLRLTELTGRLPSTGTTSRSSRRWYWPAERNLRPSIRRKILATSANVSPSAAVLPCG